MIIEFNKDRSYTISNHEDDAGLNPKVIDMRNCTKFEDFLDDIRREAQRDIIGGIIDKILK